MYVPYRPDSSSRDRLAWAKASYYIDPDPEQHARDTYLDIKMLCI